jgi:Leucine Rich repeat
LKKLEEFNLLPSPLGMVATKGDNDIINIRSFRIGDKYAEALSSGLKLSYASKINLSQNRLKPKGGLLILKGINPLVSEIDLSDNRIGETNDCIQQIVDGIILDRRFRVEVLNLDSNRITDKQLAVLADALMYSSNRTLRVLSLAQNLISD